MDLEKSQEVKGNSDILLGDQFVAQGLYFKALEVFLNTGATEKLIGLGDIFLNDEKYVKSAEIYRRAGASDKAVGIAELLEKKGRTTENEGLVGFGYIVGAMQIYINNGQTQKAQALMREFQGTYSELPAKLRGYQEKARTLKEN